MSATDKRPARPVFRKLAWGMAGVLFVLAALCAFAPIRDKAFASGACLFVAFVMLTIATTGFWPPPAKP